jgi:hypothetical protein
MRLRKLLFVLYFVVNKETLLSRLSGYFDNWAKIFNVSLSIRILLLTSYDKCVFHTLGIFNTH